MPTLKDIAVAAGVDAMTVSRGLRGEGRMAPATRKRVLETARRLGYKPNAAARAVVRGRFDAVALVLGSFEESHSILPMGLLHGISDALAEDGSRLIVSRIGDDKLTDPAFVPDILTDLCSDGLLINYNTHIPPRMAELVEQHRIPSVWINSKYAANCVYPDDTGAAREATERLIGRGHRRILYLNLSGAAHYSAADREAGYKTAMKAADLAPWVAGGFSAEPVDLIETIEGLLAGRDLPTAVLCYSGKETAAARRALITLGDAEGTCVVTGFHDMPITTLDGAFPTVLLPEAEMGRRAVAMLRKLIAEPLTAQAPEVVPCGWVGGSEQWDK